jgi:hypothetical protein
MVRELLSQNGIACVVQGGNFGALEPRFSEIRLLVLQNELSRALELYKAFFVSSEGVAGIYARHRRAGDLLTHREMAVKRCRGEDLPPRPKT